MTAALALPILAAAVDDGRVAAAPLAFEEIVAPIAARAMAGLIEDLPPAFADRLGDAATSALARALLLGLVEICSPTLLAAFDARRPVGIALLARFLDGETRVSPDGGGRAGYDAFVADMAGGGLDRLLGERPVLARAVALECAHFRDRIVELAGRLEADLPLIAEALGWHGDPGAIAALQPGLSDPHHRGRKVMLLRFASGAGLVYKPRSLAAEAAFQQVRSACDPEAPTFALLDRGTYGWAEAIVPSLPADPGQWARLSAACGRLLAILNLLGATDCHYENLIVRGDQVFLVDAESILQPVLSGRAGGEPWLGDHRPWDNVMRTGMLPYWTYGPGGGACDVGALGRRDAVRGAFLMPRWHALNSDNMSLAREPIAPAAPPPLEIDVDALVAGFADQYRALAARRETLAADPAFRALATLRIRLILRGTLAYGLRLRGALAPEHVADAKAHAAYLGGLAPIDGLEGEEEAAVRGAEQAALSRRDVPYFSVGASDRIATACDGTGIVLPGLRPAFPDLLERIARLGEPDRVRQQALIRASFAAAAARAADARADPLPYPGAGDAPFRAQALALAETIAAAALPAADGAVHWLELRPAGMRDCYAPRRAGWSLYEGQAGIALFLAGAARIGDRDDLAKAARAALAPIRAATGREPEGRLAGTGIGLGTGSLIYALTRCAGLLGDDTLLEDALRFARTLDEAAFAAETAGEPIAGTGGAILALLALHQATDEDGLVERAAIAGRRLLDRWTAPPRLTGAAHGGSGYALAFARLGGATGDACFTRAAHEALAFERGTFSPAAGNWPDFRLRQDGDVARCATMWCNGAPGIGLTRLALAGLVDDPRLDGEIEAALAATLAYGVRGDADTLCCGNFGRIDFLAEAGRRLARPELTAQAAGAAALRLDCRRAIGRFQLDGSDAPDWLKPGLFTGLSGIGHTLLRLAAPAEIPSVLTWS